MPFMILESTALYALTLCGLLVTLFAVAYLLPLFLRFHRFVTLFVAKIFFYTFLLRRHRFLGPWSVAAIVAQSVYIAANVFCLSFKVTSTSEVSMRAGRLALVNMIPLFLSPHLGFLADLLGISLRSFRKVHCSTGVMSLAMTLLHVCLMTFQGKQGDLYTLLGALLMLLLAVLSIPFLRKIFYEAFLRIHQALALFVASSICRHLLTTPSFPWLYIYIYAGVVGFINTTHFGVTLYRNIEWGRPFPRALLTQNGGSTNITVELPRPLKIDAGQYINLWIWAPKVSFWSWVQSHPFTVASWSPVEQGSLDLFVNSRRGLTSKLVRIKELECVAFLSGPHGICFPVSEYKSVMMVAADYGIVAMLPYLSKMIHGHKFFTGRVCRIHIIWHVKEACGLPAIEGLLNQHLSDKTLRKVLQISVFNESGIQIKGFGSHGRVKVFTEAPKLAEILRDEKQGNFITQLDPSRNSQEQEQDPHKLMQLLQKFQADTGKVLLLVSGTGQLRDRVRELVRAHLYENVELRELDYQLE